MGHTLLGFSVPFLWFRDACAPEERDMVQSITSWFLELPTVTRYYLAAALTTTALCYFDVLSLFHLYLDFKLISTKKEVWRLITNFLFFGESPSIDFAFHMFFLVRYAKLLEEGSFYGSSADFAWMLMLGG